MVGEESHSPMVINMKETIDRDYLMGKARTIGLMVRSIKASFRKGIGRDRVCFLIQKDSIIKVDLRKN